MDEPQLVEVTDKGLLTLIGKLRVRAWGTEPQASLNMTCWLDKDDDTALHWAFLVGGEPVAAARMTVHESIDEVPDAEVYRGVFSSIPPSPIASLNRLVVDPAYRCRGLGTALDLVRLQAARQLGCKSVVVSSSADRRISQLLRLGFEVVGRRNNSEHPVFCERGVQTVLWFRLVPNQTANGPANGAILAVNGDPRFE